MKTTCYSAQSPSKKPVEGKTFYPKFSFTRTQSNPHSTFYATSPKNFNFFGKHRGMTPRETIHSVPTTPQLKMSSILSFQYPAALLKSKTILENHLYFIDNEETLPPIIVENQILESGKYKNLEVLLQEKELFTVPERMNKVINS